MPTWVFITAILYFGVAAFFWYHMWVTVEEAKSSSPEDLDGIRVREAYNHSPKMWYMYLILMALVWPFVYIYGLFSEDE